MADQTKIKDSRDRSKPGAPQGAVPRNDQRRLRSRTRYGGGGTDDAARRTVDGSDTGGDAPMDPSDEDFIKSK